MVGPYPSLNARAAEQIEDAQRSALPEAAAVGDPRAMAWLGSKLGHFRSPRRRRAPPAPSQLAAPHDRLVVGGYAVCRRAR
jgi:hypothetical protein